MIQQPEPIEQQSVFEGKIFSARVDTVLMPDGSQLRREVVDHPGAVAIVPINDDSEVILVRQYRYPSGQRLLEIPAGTLEPGESPDVTAQRELQEEIGFASRNLRALGGFFASPGILYRVHLPLPRARPSAEQASRGRRRGHQRRAYTVLQSGPAHQTRRDPGRQKHRRTPHGPIPVQLTRRNGESTQCQTSEPYSTRSTV